MTTELDPLEESPTFPENDDGLRRHLDFLGYAPCPIRHELQRRMNLFFRANGVDFGDIAWYSPSGCGDGGDPYDTIWKDATEDEMPGAMSDGGSSDFFRREGHRKWIASGVYEKIDAGNQGAGLGLAIVRPELAEAGIEDPLGAIQLYGALPVVILVDKQKLGTRPVPRSWADLADPAYKGDITISGHHDKVPDILLFNFWKSFGEAGLRAFASNVAGFWPPAKMVKSAGSGHPEGTAIYIVNRFFALGNRHAETAEIVWPAEGAWFNPLMVLAKRGRRPVSNLPISFLLGAEWAGFIESVGLPAAHVFSGQKPLPGKLSWIGWDFIRGNDLDALRDRLLAVFQAAR